MKCRTKFCRGVATKTQRSPWCPKCRTRRFKEKFPLKYSFNLLRNRARWRRKGFDLTYEEYERFAVETGYAKLKGKTKHSLTIHRLDNAGPYRADNIAAVTLSLNNRLQFANLPDYLKAEMLAAERTSISRRLGEADQPVFHISGSGDTG